MFVIVSLVVFGLLHVLTFAVLATLMLEQRRTRVFLLREIVRCARGATAEDILAAALAEDRENVGELPASSVEPLTDNPQTTPPHVQS